MSFYPGGSGQFLYNSNPSHVNLYQGPLTANAAESSNVNYTQMYTPPPNTCTLYELYQDFQTT
ncbi:hypothetical protein JCM16161A_19400 [Vulcanisaeta sp. JCM 16161]|uniref:hypothetical protein n=1 Tax=Vulcanisaeta sp. JCM 16161 TaxID=1295372 RepID=UPI001FB403E8|nr:hypothetical protein [Vulcanisaeta sp. JCM 16161]